MSNTELNKTLQKLSSVSYCAKSDPTFEFVNLAHHFNVEFLRDCYLNFDRNKAVGVDRVSWLEYNKDLDNNLNTLVRYLAVVFPCFICKKKIHYSSNSLCVTFSALALANEFSRL